jgi:hypothetical protein
MLGPSPALPRKFVNQPQQVAFKPPTPALREGNGRREGQKGKIKLNGNGSKEWGKLRWKEERSVSRGRKGMEVGSGGGKGKRERGEGGDGE